MSTLKTTNIQHPSAGSPNLVLAADGSVSGGAGLGGLVHLHTEDFTAQPSVSIDDVFDSTYDNYRVIVNITGSTSAFHYMRFRASGSTDSTSNYAHQQFDVNGTGVSAGRSTSRTNIRITYQDTGDGAIAIDVFSPFLSKGSTVYSNGISTYAGAYVIQWVGSYGASTSFDGFSVTADAGTMTGSLSVYGYRKS